MPFDSWSATNCTPTGLGGGDVGNSFLLGSLIIILGLLLAIYFDRAFYLKSRKSVMLIINSFRYFMWGMVGVIVLAIVRAVVLYFATQGVGKIPLSFIGICLVVYIAICMIGYLIVRLKDRISQYESQSDDQEMPVVSYDGRTE
jgi:hypothetical protein